MKNRITYIWTLLAMLWLAACTPENDFLEEMNQPQGNKDIKFIQIKAHDFIGAETITRTLVEVGGEGATFKWAKNDTIGIFPSQGYQVAFPMSAGAGTQTAEFDGGNWALKPSTQYMAYYPFEYNNRSNKNVSVTYVGQLQKGNGNTDHLGAFDYMSASATTPTKGTIAFDFQHLGSLLQFKLKVPKATSITSMTIETNDHVFIRNGKLDLTQEKPSIESSDKTTSISMELSDIQTSTAGQEIIIYMMIAPTDLTGLGYTLKLSSDNGEMAEVKFDGQKFEAGKAYALSAVLGTFEEAVLQMADKRGKVIGNDGGTLTLEYLTNTECQFIISDEAKDWISLVEGRTVTLQKTSFNIAENESEENRRGIVTVKSMRSNLAVEYTILQGGTNTYAITEDQGNIPIGILSSNRQATSEEYGLKNLVDNNMSTYFEANSNNQIYIDWEGPYAIPIKSINYACNGGGYGLFWWTFHLSTDGEKYDGLGWSIGHGYGGDENSAFILNKEITARSKYYRFIIDSNHGAATTRISELGYTEDTEADRDILTLEDLIARGSSFTKSDITPMGKHFEYRKETTDDDRKWLATARNEPKEVSGYTLRPFDVNLYPFGEPVPADVNQHGIGNCCAMAVLGEMAYLFPGFIKAIITDNEDDTYTIAMYDPQGKPVDVTVQSTFLGNDSGIGACSGKDGKATWATILEKAIMKWNYIYEANPDINGIGYEQALALFTGNGNSFSIGASSLLPKQLVQALDIAFNERMFVMGGFNIGGLSYNYGPQTVTLHAYSFMYSNASDAMFSMRNPWGYNPGGVNGDDGVFDIYNDENITQTIDMRIIYPGAALPYAVKEVTPYIPPQY